MFQTLSMQIRVPMPPVTLPKGAAPLGPTRTTTFQNHSAYICGLNRVTLQNKKRQHNRNGYFGRKIREEHKKVALTKQ